MLVKYRMLPTITQQQFRDDIVGLISGTIANVSSLSAGADIANSSISGTYPTGKYTLVNSSSNTFSKIHSTSGSTTHYFRLGFAADKLQTISLAQSYTSGTDTLVNSASNTVNIIPNRYDPKYPLYSSGLTLVIANSCLSFTSVTSGTSVGIYDLGENGLTATYPDSMKMAFIRLETTDTATGVPLEGLMPRMVIPYAYTIRGRLSAYTSITDFITLPKNSLPAFQTNLSGNSVVIVETPVFVNPDIQSYAVYNVPSLFRIPTNTMATDFQYTSNNVIRQVAFSHAIITE